MTARALILVAAFAGPVVLAQQGAPTTLSGGFRNLQGRPLEGTLLLKNNRTGERREIATAGDGTYVVTSIAPGTYTVIASAPGYGPLIAYDLCLVEGKPVIFSPALGTSNAHVTVADLERSSPAYFAAALGPPSVAAAGVMSEPEIQAAIRFGSERATLEAYELKEGRRVIGKIFTPFWRIAAAARMAKQANKPFEPSQIPRPFIEDLVWVLGDREPVQRRFFADVLEVFVRPKGWRHAGDEIAPVWTMRVSTECDVNALAQLFGPHFATNTSISAFESAVISAGSEIALTYSASAFRDVGAGIVIGARQRRAVITEALLQQWK